MACDDRQTAAHSTASLSAAPLPANESERVKALLSYDILDTPPEQHFDDLALLASAICQTPIGLISLVDKDRQWFKAKCGFSPSETSRDVSFCAHAILQSDVLIIPDATKDRRFEHNPLVTGDPKIRFYAGVPIYSVDGAHALGTMCVIDRVPRELGPSQKAALHALARQAQALLELRLLLRNERELSRTDPLTGAANRRFFYETLEKELSRLKRHQRPFSIAYIDLDCLKQVNDQFGHEEGDAVLTLVAKTVHNRIRQTDTIARLGGDEFVILFPETSADGARAVTESIRRKLLEAMTLHRFPVTFSVGVVSCVEGSMSAEEIVKKADALMYQVKTSGKNGMMQATIP